MRLYCPRRECKTEWHIATVRDATGGEHEVYECRCEQNGEERLCWEDKALVDLGGADVREAGIKEARRLANLVIGTLGKRDIDV